MKASRLSLEKASFKDMDRVAQMIRSTADWYRPFVDPKDLGQHDVDDKWKEKNFKMRQFYLGKLGDDNNQKTVGTISLQTFKHRTYLGYVYLDSEFVGNGYGKQLLDYASKLSKSMRNNSMILLAHPEAKWAVKAYQKYGFKRILSKKQDILNYIGGSLKPHYEEGFELYEYRL